MTTSREPYEVHSEARGPHWVAWVSRGGSQKPNRSLVVVAPTKEEAESRARLFAELSPYAGPEPPSSS